ncbi:LacI family DNA-binding transcriptional regulator [Rhizobium sp. ICMP 5592]|uniref:LacI family DNA-binding transcriptional regulator n=1 Tax=Rhizobium sp. ICMP 5592 TaxID=2292445 RepID=UPI0012965512|nr:LacI family DNA-binding transcriptional regulator [Rhizobium sp. ICMP 5592]MQB46022.1 LacI family transcriptional regulator [Rhizobium sp. ICMP 5592]
MANQKRRLIRLDVANMAGVSVATVDRVLNGRGSVKEQTARRIKGIAADLGYAAGINDKELRLGVFLQDPGQSFLREIERHLLADKVDPLRKGYRIFTYYMPEISQDVPETSPAAIAAKIEEMAATCDVIAGVFAQHPLILREIGKATARGIPVIAFLTDLRDPQRTAFVGPDNRMVGRTAGKLMGLMLGGRAGKVLVTSDSLHGMGTSIIATEEREAGFRSAIMEQFESLEVLTSVERIENGTRIGTKLETLLRDETVIGIFNAGGRNSQITSSITASGRRPDTIVSILSELSASAHEGLINGRLHAILAHSAKQLADNLLNVMLKAGRDEAVEPATIVPLHIYLDENVPVSCGSSP